MSEKGQYFIDGSRIIVEALARAGGDIFIGYPITPANLLYLYSSERFPQVLPAPDEITTAQWMAGFSAAGKIPITATSYPGLALMIESIGMSYMMELPMVIVLAQRLGPATGTATCGAQGDISVINGINSGGFSIPTLCISSLMDCWQLPAEAIRIAAELSTPVILLTSKEMVMTLQNFDLNALPPLKKVERKSFRGANYQPYLGDEKGCRTFVPVGNERHRVRLTASTHDKNGDLQHSSPEAMENTMRLQKKMEMNLYSYTHYELDEVVDGECLLVSFDITAAAAKEAAERLNEEGKRTSVLTVKTLFPVPHEYIEICGRYARVFIIEENFSGQYMKILYGHEGRAGVKGINSIGRMIKPEEIIMAVKSEKGGLR